MKILGLNTIGNKAQVCLINEGKIKNVEVESPHSENLLPNIDKILCDEKLSLSDFDYYGVVVGPGSFTGIRIAVAMIKAMSVVNPNIKLVKISSFDLVKTNAGMKNGCLVVLDSGNEEHFVCEYTTDGMEKIFASKDDELNEFIESRKLKAFAYDSQKEKLEKVNAEFLSEKDDDFANAMLEKINNNELSNINELSPIYVKQSQAERTRSEKILKGLEIVKAEKVEDLLKIEDACFEEKWSEETFESELKQENKYYFVAKYEGEVLGYIGFERAGDDLNMQKIAVLEDYRECGIAKKLFEKSLEVMKELKLNNYFLEVNVNNKVAKRVYEKFGFKQISKRENYYKNGDACFVMQYCEY
ncbi:MAG: ribosomal protein S18-alanine N-acetyltransferase [Clostridiales bacterium]|nr:ribosomal protein S18-alanine N-acetyltransferase [Candidatus Apopatousia equi]